jgi:hypothetical protein
VIFSFSFLLLGSLLPIRNISVNLDKQLNFNIVTLIYYKSGTHPITGIMAYPMTVASAPWRVKPGAAATARRSRYQGRAAAQRWQKNPGA